jgi:hypothetical protein
MYYRWSMVDYMTSFRGYLLPKLISWRLNLQEKQNESFCCNRTKDKKIKWRRWWWMQLLLQQCFCLCDGIILIYSSPPSTRTAASLTFLSGLNDLYLPVEDLSMLRASFHLATVLTFTQSLLWSSQSVIESHWNCALILVAWTVTFK